MKKILKRLAAVALVAVMAVSATAVSLVSVSAATSYEYTVTFKTSNKFLAGTDADVYLYAYNENGSLIGKRIYIDTEGNSFEKNDTDTVTISLPEKIETIKVGTLEHIATGDGAMFKKLANANEWHLDYVKITDSNGDSKTFNFNKWIEPGYYGHYKTVRNRRSRPMNKKVYVQEKENLYTPSSVK